MFPETKTVEFINLIPTEVLWLVAQFLNPAYTEIFGVPFLAGGAVRDGLMDKPIKDWDIYFPYRPPNQADVGTIVTLLGNKWYTKSNYPGTYLITDYDESKFLHVKAWIMPTGATKNTQVDLIFSGQDIKDFDHGICQCKMDFFPCAKITTTPLFEECVKNHYHVILERNLINSTTCNKSIREHTPRILEKYPWPVMISYERY